MPSVAQESPTAPSCKKRRRDEANDSNNNNHHNPQIQVYADPLANIAPWALINNSFSSSKGFDHGGLFQHHQLHAAAARKIMPLPLAKRRRTSLEGDAAALDVEPIQRPQPNASQRHGQVHQRQDTKPIDKTRGTTTPDTPSSTPLMSRCHICFRKPTKRSDLDSFADCQGCGQRTCFVCIRECLGWDPGLQAEILVPPPAGPESDTSFTMLDADAVPEDEGEDFPQSRDEGGEGKGSGWARGGGHRQVVCSQCCVERGPDGDVVCLGCLPFVEG